MNFRSSFRRVGLLGSAAFALANSAAAQQTQADPNVPALIAHGRGETTSAPNRAELTVQVETRGADGARASQQNAAIVKAVLDTLRMGFQLTDRDLVTTGYSLQPQMVYPGDGKAPQVVGFIAMNSVRVRTERLDRVGAIIDAAIKKGATSVAGLNFYSANVDEARRTALAQAVENARRDAEVMARAAGGQLGALIELTSEQVDIVRPPMPMFEMRAQKADVATQVQPGEEKITAVVTGRWRFVPAR
jgi:uncharacterized protein YggE